MEHMLIAVSFVLGVVGSAYPHSCVAWWAFNEPSGTSLFDSSGSGNTAYITAGTRVAGVSGNGLSFNGTSDYAYANNATSLVISNQITIECWVKPRQLNPVIRGGADLSP